MMGAGGNRIAWAAATRSGSRKERNDDSWTVFGASPRGAVKMAETGEVLLDVQDLVLAVSDGMGGGNAGDLASGLIVERMAALIPETFKAAAAGFFPDSVSQLMTVLTEVHGDINKAAGEEADCKGMAATLALTWFAPENLYLANVGDSRVYRSRDGRLEQLSKDHTMAWGQWKRGEIQEAQYRVHPRRAALYEVMGGGHEGICPHLAAVAYRAGDRFLVCSDGVIDGVWERNIGDALSADKPLEVIRGELLERAFSNSGEDDTTLIVIEVR
ncbi:MAG: PP2C family protein-serine/threonine phosphatase [Luteolibacter sp.]